MPSLVKYLSVILLIVLGLFAYQYLDNQIIALRVLVFLLILAAAGFVFFTTPLGATCKEFLKNARLEFRKIKWADKKSTGQMTLIIFIIVFIVGLFLWLIDSIVFRLLQWIIN